MSNLKYQVRSIDVTSEELQTEMNDLGSRGYVPALWLSDKVVFVKTPDDVPNETNFDGLTMQ